MEYMYENVRILFSPRDMIKEIFPCRVREWG